jgi:hypothetical protein
MWLHRRRRRLPRVAEGRTVEESLAQELVEQARTEGVELVGPDGLLTGLTKTALETALEAELGEHLGYPKHSVEGVEHEDAAVAKIEDGAVVGGLHPPRSLRSSRRLGSSACAPRPVADR